jgi:hypothetical protein|nr:hypothetical protein [Candidatus Krumholzibacteria bacterium]
MTRHQTQRDIWVVALLTASVVLGLGAAGLILANPMSMVLMVGFLVICLGGAGMSLLFLVRT